MINRDSCFGCRKHSELNSLRAAVKRFEDGTEIKKLSDSLGKAEQKLQKMLETIESLRKDNAALRSDNRSLKAAYENECRRTEKLISVNEQLHSYVSELEVFGTDLFINTAEQVVSQLNDQIVQLLSVNEDLEGKVLKMEAQIKRDFKTSSKPSSQCPNRAPIQNGREKTGRKQGGQPGHKGHGRKQLEKTDTVDLSFPDEVKENPSDYEYIGVKTRKLTDVHMEVTVTEVRSAVFRNKTTGKEVYRDFPEGFENEINYGAGLKALCCMANNYLNMPLRKVSAMLKDLTYEQIEIAPSTIYKLSREFSKRTKKERGEIFRSLITSPFMHSDATTIRIDGKQYYVYISSNGKDVLYQFREKKGYEGLKGTPVEEYMFVLIHDHDVTYFKYGGAHQKCESHEARYVKDSIANEPELEWNRQMDEHLKWIIHNFKEGLLSDEDAIQKAKERYYEILDLAMEEYEKVPESRLKYYREGFNTAKRLKEYGEDLLYFLTHPEIPYTNNEAERRARRIKGKMRVIGTFRSFQSAIDYLKFMSYMETSRDDIDNKYAKLVEVFS